MTNKTLHKVLVKLAAVLAILFLVLPTGLTAVTVLAEQINTENLIPVETAAGEILKESDLDFEQAIPTSGEALKDSSASWIQLTYNKVNQNLAKQDLFLRLPQGMTIEGIGQDQKLDVKTISVPKDLDLDEAASTINNTNIITGFEKIGEQDYKLSFAATSKTLNLVFKVKGTSLNEKRELQLSDKQNLNQTSFTKILGLGIAKSDDRTSANDTTTRPSIQPRAATDRETTGNQDISANLTTSNAQLNLEDKDKNNIYDVEAPDSFMFRATLSLLDSRYIVPGNYFELKLSDTIHYNMLNPTDINFPYLTQDGKVIAVPELVQDPPVDGLLRATGKIVRYRFTDQVQGLDSLTMTLNLGHSVNPNVVQNNDKYDFSYQIGGHIIKQSYDVQYGKPKENGNLNVHQRLTYTDSKQNLKASSLIYVNPKQTPQYAGKQTLSILRNPKTYTISEQTVPNLLELNNQTSIKVYKLKDSKGVTDAVNLDKQYLEEVINPIITKSDGKIEVSFNYTQGETSAYVVAVETSLQQEGSQPVFIAQNSNLTSASTRKKVSETDATATVGSGGSASGDQTPKGTLYLNKVDTNHKHLANATFTLSGNTTAGQFLYRTLITDTKEVSFSDLPPGSYLLKETTAPSGYQQITTPWTVTVDDKGKVTVTGNEADTQKVPEEAEVVILWESTKWNYGNVQFYKDRFKELVDSVGNQNAKYTLIRYSGDTSDSAQVINQSVSSAEFNKILNSETLTASTMTNRKGMLKAYQLALQQFQASTNKRKYLLQLTNYPIYPGYREEKDFMSQSQTSFDAMKSLGVVPYLLVERDPYANRNTYLDPKAEASSFGAFYPSDNIKVVWSNNSSGLFTPPTNTNYTIQIQSIGSAIKQQIPESVLTVINRASGKFSINKIDEAKKGLAGATFTLSKRTTVAVNHQVQGAFTPVSKETTAGRTTLTFDNLKPGVYDLKETKAPNAYVLDPKTYVVVVQNSGKTTIVDEANFKEADYPMADNTSQFDYPTKDIANKPNKIVFTKIGDGGKSLSGAEFELRKGNEKVQTTKSKDDGQVTFTKLLPGTYEVWETKVADSAYQLPKEAVATFEVKADGTFSEPMGRLFKKNSQQNNRYEIRNDLINKKTGNQKIKVIKKDELTEVPLPNAKFQLEASDGTIYTKTTDVKGEIVFEKLPYGQYILTEIEAPTGYVLDKTPQKINITEVSALETEVVAGRDATQPTVAPAARAALAAPVAEPVTGKNVSDQISIKELDITSSNEATPHNVRPNHGENIVMRADFTIKPGSDIKAGDFFTLTLPNTIDPFGVSAPENVDFRILGPLGTLALGTYDPSTHTITYKFTDYITRYAVSSFSTISPFFIDRYTVKTNQKIDLFLKIGQVSSDLYHFTVDYNPYYGIMDTDNPVNIGSIITRLNQDTGDFVNYVYINPAGQSLLDSTFTLTGNGSTILDNSTKVQVFEVNYPNIQMPPSWGIDDSSLTETNRYYINKQDGKISINFYNDLYLEKSYIVKISGKSDLTNNEPVHTSATLTQRRYISSAYWTHTGRYIPSGPYTETFTYNAGVLKRSGESNADGSVVVRLSNRKNYIDFMKSNSQGTPLEATFELRKKATNDMVTVGTPVISDKTTGKFYFEGLPPGDYEVWETKAPDGYTKPVEAVATFKVTDEGEIVDKSLEDGRIINYKRPELPATGGPGIFVYLFIGSSLCLVAFFWNRSSRFTR
ncbi:TPA: fibrinogen-binding adhesin SdrG C-terminal domain-containing protein [Streptococcus pyogenes]|uniref:SpaA isopeptide-forming pilin-related protein n=1 Tax=Streptococcus pyogenes TaxID=1314 RepID=UPI000971CC05|nr:SpaA isopeptide-forming pilin-related protein [Streptococcus pyogenes]SDV92142.1 Fibronectin-binding protein [Streptococcus pyogenes]HEP1232020.1 fibrinogen-binding adhesin SdrG C-terminal domain-containing protein [Streptococcus pyogenes]HEP1616009.1 fibrinogen-binding adhesin SdrG C-terminal domain-containing protein [Streptococcus pyogenes]HEP1705937.1 fibrinogen-binding adhesin SdrG C-terminal domain-containing protein [Streptococcus pyogenes]HEP1884795.1 fibrinogen-binding adhesin SdrG